MAGKGDSNRNDRRLEHAFCCGNWIDVMANGLDQAKRKLPGGEEFAPHLCVIEAEQLPLDQMNGLIVAPGDLEGVRND